MSAGAWIDGMEVVYETASGRIVSQKHGGNGGAETVIDLAGMFLVRRCVANTECMILSWRSHRSDLYLQQWSLPILRRHAILPGPVLAYG